MNRLVRLLRTRWWLVVGVALINAWIAGYLTDLRNRELPRWEAVAVVSYTPRLGEVDDEPVLTRLSEGAAAAEEVNEGMVDTREGLFGWQTAAIEAEERSKRLLFIGRSDDPSDAEEIAEDLRQRFIDGGFLDAARLDELDGQLQLILEELRRLRQRIDTATEPDEVDPVEELQRLLLTDEAAALRGRFAGLSAQLLAPPEERTIASIEDELNSIRQRLEEIQIQLGTLPAPPIEGEEGTPPEESLPITIDRLQYEQLQGVYQELFLRRLEAGSGGTVPGVTLQASSLQPASKGLSQAVGALVGVAAAIFGLSMTDRARDLIWSGAEVGDAYILEEFPPRPLWTSLARPWYLRSPPGDRKSGIQKLRSIVEGLESDAGVTLGVSGISVSPEDVHELTADLGVSLAVSGRRVLLIDTDVHHPSRLVEFGRDELTLAQLLRVAMESRDGGREEIAALLDSSSEVIPNLYSVSAGRHQLDAADTLSRPEFGVLMEITRRRYDMIIVSGADASEPSAHVLSQRLEAMILIGAAGRTAAPAVSAVTRSLAGRRARLLGLVLLSRSFGGVRQTMRRLRIRSSRRGRQQGRRTVKNRAPSVTSRLRSWGRSPDDSAAGKDAEQSREGARHSTTSS